jgi:hypothetical protein
MDELPFPKSLGPYPTRGGGTWSAELDGFNGRYELAYYLVTVSDAEGPVWCCFVEVDVTVGEPYVERFRIAIQPRADGEGQNTNYTGNMARWLPARKAEAKARAARAAARAEKAASER